MGRWQFYLGAILSIGMSGAAYAQSARAELHGGIDRVSHRSFFSPSDSTFEPVEGGVYGLGVGYDAKINDRIFAGIEGNVDFTTGSYCQVNPLVLAPGIFESCLTPERDLSANARLGVNLGTGRTRIYGLLGYTNLGLTSSFQINRGPATSLRSDNRDGVRVGAGFEYDLTDRFYGKIEYRFSDYGSGINRKQALVGLGIRF
jgi:outer membrane immunogenic protein